MSSHPPNFLFANIATKTPVQSRIVALCSCYMHFDGDDWLFADFDLHKYPTPPSPRFMIAEEY